MRIAESYFHRLLFETESREAVSMLASFWAPRARAELPDWGLAVPEFHVTLCLIYTGEVGNGGHMQFFLNRGRRVAREVLQALIAASLIRENRILQRAIELFPDGHIPDEPDEVEVKLDRLPAGNELLLRELGIELWAKAVDDTLLAYLRDNARFILLPERGLAD